jgi:hypothetical protein
LDKSEDLLNDLSQVWVRVQVVPLESTRLLGFVVLEISLVLGSLKLNLSKFLDLVVVDDKDLVSIGLVGECVLGVSGGIWLLEADESVGITGLTFVKSDILDLTVLLEEISEVVLSPFSWEVLDVEVASLL